jgi:hypothetical protein
MHSSEVVNHVLQFSSCESGIACILPIKTKNADALLFWGTGAEVPRWLCCSFVCLVSQDKAQAGRTAEQRKHVLLDDLTKEREPRRNQARNLLARAGNCDPCPILLSFM